MGPWKPRTPKALEAVPDPPSFAALKLRLSLARAIFVCIWRQHMPEEFPRGGKSEDDRVGKAEERGHTLWAREDRPNENAATVSRASNFESPRPAHAEAQRSATKTRTCWRVQSKGGTTDFEHIKRGSEKVMGREGKKENTEKQMKTP